MVFVETPNIVSDFCQTSDLNWAPLSDVTNFSTPKRAIQLSTNTRATMFAIVWTRSLSATTFSMPSTWAKSVQNSIMKDNWLRCLFDSGSLALKNALVKVFAQWIF